VGHHGGKARAGLQIEQVFLAANNVFKLPKEQHSHTHIYKDNGNSTGHAGGNIGCRGKQHYLFATFMRLNTYQSIRLRAQFTNSSGVVSRTAPEFLPALIRVVPLVMFLTYPDDRIFPDVIRDLPITRSDTLRGANSPRLNLSS
jgi:hypothetical protein